jgi:capsular polysaccharide biosynthesis protein
MLHAEIGCRRPVKPPSTAPRVSDYICVLARWWFTISCATVLSAGVGWLSWHESTPIYQSNAKILVTSPGAASTFDALYGQLNSESRAFTYQQLARSSQVTTSTIEQLRLPETTDELAGRIIVPPSATNVFDVGVTGTSPEQTQQIANAVTGNLINLSKHMATVDGSGIELVPWDQAGPAYRVGSMGRLIVQGAVLGLVLSMLLVVAYARTRDRLQGPGQIVRVVRQIDADVSR